MKREIDKMVLFDLEEFHKVKNELVKTIVDLGEKNPAVQQKVY